MKKAILDRWITLMVIGIISSLIIGGCGSKNAAKEAQEREYQTKLKEARELAAKIRSGDIFDEEAIIREKILKPVNVCAIGADLASFDFGPRPDFRADGNSAIYADKSTTVYYYYFITRQVFKLGRNGRNPSFGMLTEDENDQKYIYEYYVLRENSWEGDSKGIMLNDERNWLNDPKLITDIPAEEPFLINQDQEIVYHIGAEYFKLDDKMQINKIAKAEYENWRNSRYAFEHEWKTVASYRGMNGVWLTDKDERNWCQLREAKEVKSIIIIPSSYNIYFWGQEKSGICMLKPVELSQYTIQLKSPANVSIGDLFDVYEKELSPISQEVIGYNPEKFKGTLRVIEILGDKLICEFQTRLHMEAIFAKDAVIARNNSSILGSIL
ncbi:hypothetical protein JXA40_11320 [bacterium]|nr:hypothetical protein [candidate division CSSED10-310 bacterium]